MNTEEHRTTVRRRAERRGVALTAAQVDIVCDLEGDDAAGPTEDQLIQRFTAGELDSPVLTYLVPQNWRRRSDTSASAEADWRAMLLRCQYTRDLHVHPLPLMPRVAFRGSTTEGRERLSWTLDLRRAQREVQALREDGESDARVWLCWIPGERMLARYRPGSGPGELTADVRGLEIAEAARLSAPVRALVAIRGRYPSTS